MKTKIIQTLKCPYNQAHIVPRESFLNHLRKCQAKNKNDFAQCKYDLYHIVKKQLLTKHYLQCNKAQKNDNQNDDDDWNNIKDESSKQHTTANWEDDQDIFIDQDKKDKRCGRNFKNAAPEQSINSKDKKYQKIYVQDKKQSRKYKETNKSGPKKESTNVSKNLKIEEWGQDAHDKQIPFGDISQISIKEEEEFQALSNQPKKKKVHQKQHKKIEQVPNTQQINNVQDW